MSNIFDSRCRTFMLQPTKEREELGANLYEIYVRCRSAVKSALRARGYIDVSVYNTLNKENDIASYHGAYCPAIEVIASKTLEPYSFKKVWMYIKVDDLRDSAKPRWDSIVNKIVEEVLENID